MHPGIRKIVVNAANGWQRYGFIPCEAKVVDWGCQGCSRPVVVLTHSQPCYDEHGNLTMGDTFLDEGITFIVAKRIAQSVERLLDCLHAKHVA